MGKTSEKLVLVLPTFAPIIGASKEDIIVLDKVFYIHYLLCFCKNKENKVQALINSSSKVNAITPAYALKLRLKVCYINVKAQKINSSTFKIFIMILVSFQGKDKQGQDQYFWITFLLADTSVKVILGMFFLIFNRVDI